MMSNRVAVIENGVVTAIVWNDGGDEQLDIVACPVGNGVEPGWRYGDGQFLTPVQQRFVPDRVTLAQARAALIAAGLFDAINAYVMGSGDPTLKTAWEYSNTVARNGAFVTALAPQFGLTDTQLDDLFIAASQIDF